MNLPFFIARRYFFSRKKKSFINVISIISMLVVAIGTMSLIIVLSVFNGLEGLLRGMYGTVDPQLVVRARLGKSFAYDQSLEQRVATVPGVERITGVLEDNVLLKYNAAQRVARVKGVSADFEEADRLDAYLVYGDGRLMKNDIAYAILGRGVQYDLSVNPASDLYTLQMYYPKDIRPGVTNPERMFNLRHILPASVFAIEKSYDENLVFVPLAFAEELFDKKGQRSALEIGVVDGFSLTAVRDELRKVLGAEYEVLSTDELHADLYRILSMEKFFVFLTFSLIIAIASINIFFALTMLAIDKRKDVAILGAQGATPGLIRRIFLYEGCIVAFTGAFTGLLLGLLVCVLQQQFGWVTMGVQTAIVDAYPVKILPLDIAYTMACIVCITLASAVHPALGAARNMRLQELQ